MNIIDKINLAIGTSPPDISLEIPPGQILLANLPLDKSSPDNSPRDYFADLECWIPPLNNALSKLFLLLNYWVHL